MSDNDATSQPTLDTVIEMLKSLQLDSAEIKGKVSNIESRVSNIEGRISNIESELARQAKQLDKMATYQHGFASDLYELRLEFRQFREAITGALPQIAK